MFKSPRGLQANGPFYTVKEVAEIFMVPRCTIDRWHRTRPDFPRKRNVGQNSVRFRRDEVDAYIAKLSEEI